MGITSSKYLKESTAIAISNFKAMNKQIFGLLAVALLLHSGVNAMENSYNGPDQSTGKTYDCSQAGQFPSPYSCAEYYVCVYTNPKAYVFHCPADLLYDPILRVCNWPQVVNCDLSN